MNNQILKIYAFFLKSPNAFIDSRKVDGPGIFFALKGGTTDGNIFASSALENGASLAIVDDPQLKNCEKCFYVEDSLVTLQQLSAWHRRQFNMPIIAITGSNGKTTTKELSNAICTSKYNTLATQGNKNNHIGLPLTLLRLNKSHEIAILEMGANHPNDIKFLCQLCAPTHGLITNIGKAHLEGFKHIDNVFNTKKELFDYLEENRGYFFLNMEEPFAKKFPADFRRYIKYGSSNDCKYEIVVNRDSLFLKGYFKCNGKRIEFKTRIFGGYNAGNVSSAISLGLHFGVDGEDIKKALEDFQSESNRSQLIKVGSCNIILDAYNANPDSMEKAIESFMKISAPKKILILGDMLELGMYAEQEHQNILGKIDLSAWEDVILIGSAFGEVNKNKYQAFKKLEESMDYLKNLDISDAWILIKGSRGLALERAMDYLMVPLKIPE